MTNDDVARTAVNQAPYGGTDYPFVAANGLTGAVLDAYVSYYDPGGRYALPLRLDVGAGLVRVLDYDQQEIASWPAAACITRAWGTRSVVEFTSDPVVLRLVLAAGLQDGAAVPLDPRTCNRATGHVRSFRVGLVRVTGNVRFESGYNVPVSGANPTDPVEGERFRPRVSMDAVPGAGAGRLSGCDESSAVLKRINKIGPDCAGNFTVAFDDCFRAQLPLVVTGGQGEVRTAEYGADGLTAAEAEHAVKLYSDCHPCCECDYYVRTYRGLKRVWNRWKAVAASAEEVRDVYADNVARWNEARDCKLAHPARLLVRRDPSCKTAVGGSFCNFTSCCVPDIEIRFTLERYASGVLIPWEGGSGFTATISGSFTDGEEDYAPAVVGDSQVFRFFFPYADGGGSSIAKIRFCASGCGGSESLRVTMTAHAATPAPNPQTGDTCETPEVVVPVDVLSLWDSLELTAAPTVRAVEQKTVALNPNEPSSDTAGC